MTNSTNISVGRALLSGSVLRVMNLVAAAAASFFLMPFIVHHLGDRVYGFWSVATAFIGYYNLLDLGFSSAISQYMCIALGKKDLAESRAVFNTALRLQVLIGGAAFAVTLALVAATPLFCHQPADIPLFRGVIALLGINAALGFPGRVFWAALESELRFDIQSWLASLSLVLRTGLVVAAIWSGGGLLALAWMALLATVPITLLQIWLARRQAPWARMDRSFFKPQKVRNFFSYSAYSFLSSIADMVRFQLDPIVISGMIGLAAVTHYKVAGVLAQYYFQIIFASAGMLLPVLSRIHGSGNRVALQEVFFFGTRISCFISVLICLEFVGWGKPFIARWMGPAYEDGYLPLVLLSFAVLLDVCQISSVNLLFATLKNQTYAWINGTEAVLNLVLSLALVRSYGILGVAAGTFISAFAIRIVVQPWWVCKISGLHYWGYMRFLASNLLRCILLAAAAIAIAAWGLRPNYFWLVASSIIACATYATGAWFVLFNDNERNRFMRAFRKKTGVERANLAIVAEMARQEAS